MTIIRRIVFCVSLSALVLMATSLGLWAQPYPSRAIEFVISWPPGGPADISGRIFANDLSKVLKVPVTPINKPGAAGTVGATYVYKARKDGYTLFCGTLGWTLGSITLEDILYDYMKDFIPISKIAVGPHSIAVKSDSPIKTLQDFIDKAKKNPRSIPFGTAGTSSDGHFNIEILQKAAGIEIKHVPFKGGGDLPPALLGGHVEAVISVASSLVQFVRAGNMRILAITGESRIKDFPDAPTLKEIGFKEPFLNNWSGFMAPAGVPKAVVDTLAQASEKVIKSKDYVAAIEKTASIVEYMTPAEFKRMMEVENKVADSIATELGLKKGKK